MLSFRFWYSASCDSFLRSLFRITGTTSMSQLFPCGSQLISLGLRFRFRIFGFRIFSLSRLIQLFFLVFPKQLRYINKTPIPLSTTFFTNFVFFLLFLHVIAYVSVLLSIEKVQVFPGPCSSILFFYFNVPNKAEVHTAFCINHLVSKVPDEFPVHESFLYA